MELPAPVEDRLLELAAASDLLLFGELHGTREVPALVSGLLPKLRTLGYGGLALEVPCDHRDQLAAWAKGQLAQVPSFFAAPTRDGRGSVEVLGLVSAAAAHEFKLVCFDQGPDQLAPTWADRDRWMASNLLDQWASLGDGVRVVAICGSLHARLAPDRGFGRFLRQAASGGQELWPSLAGWLQQRQPGLALASVNIRFAAGEYFNMGQRTIYARPGAPPDPWITDGQPTSTIDLWLPRATQATFLAQPH